MAVRSCALAVDGSAALVEDVARGLAVVPLHIRLGDAEFIDDGDTANYAAFYKALRDGGSPSTSTPAPGEYLDAFRRLDAEHIVCLTIPERWSGMHHAATLAAQLLSESDPSKRVTVVDAGTAIGGLALVARVVAERCAAGAAADEVLAVVNRACAEVRLFGALSTLTYVAKSGRVNSLIAGISNSLHVRPVFQLHSGRTGRVALTRTASGAVDALVKAAGEQLRPVPHWLLIFHADVPADAEALGNRLGDSPRSGRCEVVELSPVGGAYTGPGAFGFAALPLD